MTKDVIQGAEGIYANFSHLFGLMREAAESGDTDEVERIAEAIRDEMGYYNGIGIRVEEMGSSKIERWRIHVDE